MIIPMKKISFLLYHKEKESFLSALQNIGVIQIEINQVKESENLSPIQAITKRVNKTIQTLNRIAKNLEVIPGQVTKGNAEEIISQFEETEQAIEIAKQRISKLNKSYIILKPWGNFEPASFEKLEDAGINVRFFEMPAKIFNGLSKSDLFLSEISRDTNTIRFIAFEKGTPLKIDAHEVSLPNFSLEEVKKKIKIEKDRITQHKKTLQKQTQYINILKEYPDREKEKYDFEAALQNMEEYAEGKILNFTGWIPESLEERVIKFLDKSSTWYTISNPEPNDNVPIKLKNRKFSKVFEPITRIFDLPDYFELDPTPFFAPFYAFFFGLCLGDVGYGLVLFLISIFAIIKVSQQLRPLFILGSILSLATIISGVFLNSFFGQPIFSTSGAESAFFSHGAALALLKPMKTESGIMLFPAMTFSIYIGLLQIILGIILRSINKYKNRGTIHIIQPISNIFFIVGITIILAKVNFLDLGIFTLYTFKIGETIASVPTNTEWYLIAIGLFLFLFFNNPEKKLTIRLPLGIWELYTFSTSLMADSLSYVRLFALGMASSLLGLAFNNIALMLITKDGKIEYGQPIIIATILILIIGHAINLILASIGSFVHPLRLTFVEFYKNLEFKGSGKPYTPFAKSETNLKKL